jgi:hypothetical protein
MAGRLPSGRLMAKKRSPSYTHPGGVLGLPRRVVRSPACLDLSLKSRWLMIVLQDVWKPYEPVIHYSARRAAEKLGVTPNTAAKAFHELAEHGFIECIDEADWFNGQARIYRLTWLPSDGREPTNEWMQWTDEKQSTVTPSDTVKPKSVLMNDTVSLKHTNSPTKNQQVRSSLHPRPVSLSNTPLVNHVRSTAKRQQI